MTTLTDKSDRTEWKPTPPAVPNDKLAGLATREEALMMCLLLRDGTLMNRAVSDGIKPQHFQTEVTHRMYTMAYDHHERYGTILSRPALDEALASTRTPEEAAMFRSKYDSIVAEFGVNAKDYPMLRDALRGRLAHRQGWDILQRHLDTMLTATSGQMDIVEEFKKATAAVDTGHKDDQAAQPTRLADIAPVADDARWLVKGVIPRRGFTLIAAPPKSGKSMVAMDLAIAVSHGERWMTELDTCVQGPVLYLSLDQATELTRDRMARLGADMTADVRLFAAGQVQTIDMGGREAMGAYLRERREAGTPVALVIVDIWQNWASAKETRKNAYQADYAALGEVRAICEEEKTTFVLLHHTNKLGEVSGSTAFGGAPDCVIHLGQVPLPRRPVVNGWRVFRRLQAKLTSRWGGLDELTIDMWGEALADKDAEGRAVIRAAEAPHLKAESLREAILMALATVNCVDAAISVGDVKDLCWDMGRNDSGGAIKKAMQRMVADGLIERAARGNYYLANEGSQAIKDAQPPTWRQKTLNPVERHLCPFVPNSVSSCNDNSLGRDTAGDMLGTKGTSPFLDAPLGTTSETDVPTLSPSMSPCNSLEYRGVSPNGDKGTRVYIREPGDTTDETFLTDLWVEPNQPAESSATPTTSDQTNTVVVEHGGQDEHDEPGVFEAPPEDLWTVSGMVKSTGNSVERGHE